MKLLCFAAALTLSAAASAQEPQPAPDAPATTVAPGNSAPETDARGIKVISDPATAPPGVNQPVTAAPGAQVVPNPNAAAAFAPQPSTENYPICSRTVTDNCVQSYERGVRTPN